MRVPALIIASLLALMALAGGPAKYAFALSLSPSTDGRLFCLFLVGLRDSAVVESRPLTRESFIRQVQGRTFSHANPDAEDLFRKYDVKACTLPPDSAAMGFLTDCTTLDDLWKLRYWEFPVKTADSQHMAKGWSEKPLVPSPRQMQILAGYGLRYPNGLIIGEQLFRLLRDMGDPAWVNNYRNGG